jgi:pimeloyl-ACP methyl ester carboxylesterase/SAM-dependent methyltransferase
MRTQIKLEERSRQSVGDHARERLLAAMPVTERRLRLAGISTAVLEGGNGPPVVLLHGPGEFAATWMRVIPDLVTTNRVVAPDLPGHGASDVADGPLDAGHVFAWLDEMIEQTCPSPPVLVGHLLGGTIAARFAIERGDRISRLVLVDSYGLGPFRPAPSFALAMISFMAWPSERTMERLFRGCFTDLDGLRAQMGERWEPLATYGLDRARTPSMKAALRRLMSQFGIRAIPPEDLARIAVPTTLIWGRHDLQVRLRVAEAASARYGWPLHVIEHAADDPAFEQPEAFLAALRPTMDGADERRDAFAGRLFQSSLNALEMLSVYLGDKLGWYRALSESGPATPSELAGRTGTQERYTREWLEQQAVARILAVDDPVAAPNERRYSLPPGHEEVLLDTLSLTYLPPLVRFLPTISQVMPDLLRAYRHGGGVAYARYGDDARDAQAAMNRPAFAKLLGSAWLPSLPEVHVRLGTTPPARVADIACGYGWSSIAIAQAYPNVLVDGFDSDGPSIERARQNAIAAGVSDRVTFHVQDAASPDLTGRYDLVAVFEALHDMARPVEALRTMRDILADGGTAIVMDERVAEAFTVPGDDVERFMYVASILFCLPTGMAEQPSAGTGTVMRPTTLKRYAQEAGFRDVEILPIEHDFFRFYGLVV